MPLFTPSIAVYADDYAEVTAKYLAADLPFKWSSNLGKWRNNLQLRHVNARISPKGYRAGNHGRDEFTCFKMESLVNSRPL